MTRVLSLAALIGVLVSTAGRADAIVFHEIEQIIRREGSAVIGFTETRDSPWLDSPRESRGVFVQEPDMLEKRILEPRFEKWTLHRDRAEWAGSETIESRAIYYAEAPQLAILASAIRGIVMGDIQNLKSLFEIELSGTLDAWSMTLQPRDTKLAGALEAIECTGNAKRLETIVIRERNGQLTTTRLHDIE